MSRLRKPIKSLGQNFLVDRNIIDKIVASAAVSPQDNVLEIGPGRGALTSIMSKLAGKLLLVEYDHALAADLKQLYGADERITVLDADILAVDLQMYLAGEDGKWKVVANLPYNISTQVLFRLLDVRHRVSRMVLMLQREVAERLTAPPDCSDYGITTVLLGLWYDMRIEFIVPPGCFFPAPKVESAVISFVPLERPRVDVGNEEVFRRVVKAAFSMRRKTLSNCLKGAQLAAPERMARILDECGIDGRRRGETLTMPEFAAISRLLSAQAAAE